MKLMELRQVYMDEREKLEALQEKTFARLIFLEGALNALSRVDIEEPTNG
jgi:hypothetical protein